MKKIVLAYSGGLDTSIILRWLQENYKAEIIAYTSDIGQEMDEKKIIRNAKRLGVKKIIIENSISDGLDVDFSELLLNYVKINNSFNDCADFSFGDYFINDISVLNCGDKGISIGEKSKIEILKSFVSDSYIGISVKDFSQLNLELFNSVNTDICLEAKQKKQEFGGALISFSKNNCESNNSLDFNSIIKKI